MKRLIIAAIAAMAIVTAKAQNWQYNAVAKAERNMQTGEYQQATPQDLKIVRTANQSVLIGNKKYTVVRIDESIRTDSLESTQFTTNDPAGNEFVIKFEHDPWEKTELLKWRVILMNTAHPYDWTYYFCRKPLEFE